MRCKNKECWAVCILSTLGAGLGLGLGLYFGLMNTHANGNLRVTALSNGNTTTGRRLLTIPTPFAPSLTACAYADVDALTLNVAEVRFSTSLNSGNLVSTDWGASQTVVLSPGVNNIPLEAVVPGLGNGDYYAADFVFWNRWNITATCQTHNAFLYTTPNGVVSLPSVPDVMPSNYGPFQYDFMNGFEFVATTGSDMALNTQAQGHQSFINSVYPYTVTSGSTATLVVDTAYVVVCYDGTRTSSQWQGMIPPMGVSQSVGTATPTVAFNWSAPQFGLANWNVPVFVNVASGPLTVVGETYAFTRNTSLLPLDGTASDWSPLTIVTATWSSADYGATLLDMRARGSNYDFLSGGYLNFTNTALGVWSFYNGPQTYFSYSHLSAYAIHGFRRLVGFTDSGVISIVDGPDCGQSIGGNSTWVPACTNTTTLVQYRLVKRQ